MTKVYVLNKGGHDYSDAQRFGDLVYCSEGLLPKFNTSNMVRIFTDALKDSQPTDYILLTSLSTMCAIACAIFASRHGRLNLLIHKVNDDGRGNRYVERVVQLGDTSDQSPPASDSSENPVRNKHHSVRAKRAG